MEKKINCIIVDDEPLSLEILQRYIEDVPLLNLICSCNDAFEAIEAIKKQSVDLMFLDINMPKLSGLQMLKSLENPPKVIFTTAYPEFAVEGFEVNAVDYLLKPFDFERFMKAVNKYDSGDESEAEDVIWLKSDKKLHRVLLDDIYYVESLGDYLKFAWGEKSLVVHERMQTMEDKLIKSNFCRIHRSYLISLNKLEFVEGNRVGVGGVELPIGQKYKEAFQKIVKSRD